MKLAIDPPVSEKQRRAMWAAKEGHSTLGIPKNVGEEFVGKDAKFQGKTKAEWKREEELARNEVTQATSHNDHIKAQQWLDKAVQYGSNANQAKDAANIKAAGVMHITKDGRVLLLKRSKNGDHAGEWGIAGGKVEAGDDNLTATAYREVEEELGEVPPGKGGMKAANRVKDGVDFTTFFNLVDQPFIPTLDSEHTGFTWARMDALPSNTHPGVVDVVEDLKETGLEAAISVNADMEPEDWSGLVGGLLKFISEEAAEPEHAEDRSIALDEGSVRDYDADGRLHVAKTHISKANVCPYYGREIPLGEQLGLQPDRLYNLYRHPDELKASAETFNNLPLLSRHVAVGPDAHPSDLVIGSTGTDAEFIFPYLNNSLVVWTRGGIAAIEEEVQKELSCAYRYRADMTPGTIDGQSYDGVMRDIVGNHVALVKAGRAGPDVVVGDAALPNFKELFMPNKTVLSSKANVAKGALYVFLRPLLAADAQIDLTPVLKDVNQANFGDKKEGIFADIQSLLKGKLAKDAKLDGVMPLLHALDAFKEEEEDDDNKKKGEDSDEDDGPKAKDAEEEDEDDDKKKKGKDKKAKDMKAKDAEEEDKKKAEDKKGMDAAIDTAVSAAVKKAKDDARSMREAERVIRPYVGELAIACDSADDVYRVALETLGVDTKGVHPSAFRAILKVQPIPGSSKTPAHAMDSASVAGFNERFPDAARIKSL